MKRTNKQTKKPNLLDLFIICNMPSSTKFELFCKFLADDDVYEFEYFEASQVENLDLQSRHQLNEGYFDKTYFEYRSTEGWIFIEGFKFGTYNSYEDAVCAAQAYTAESLLEKYFAVYEEAKDMPVQNDRSIPMEFHEEDIEEYNKIPPAIRISEHETVCIEDLIAKVAIVEQVLYFQSRYNDLSVQIDMPELLDNWAVEAVLRNLIDVKNALKCGLYGYEEARNH